MPHDSQMRAMTWNLEGADGESAKGREQRQRISEMNADVLVLTEARISAIPHGYKHATSAFIPIDESDAHFAIIAAAEPESVQIPELPTAAAALVTHNTQTWLVVGICMPWRRDAPPLPPDAAPQGISGPEAWRHVLDQLDACLGGLRKSHPQLPVLLAGDFNQTLVGHVVGSGVGREQLQRLLTHHGLVAFTAASPSALPDCPSIDHICARASKGEPVTWLENRVTSRPDDLSDHAGYLVELIN
jgi:endonuclease/exonuclease/phosphatase family metal-dependent hydrolase